MQAYLANNAQKWKQDNIENKNHEDALKELLKCTNPRQTCAKNIMISIFFDGTGNHKERDFSKGHILMLRGYMHYIILKKQKAFSQYICKELELLLKKLMMMVHLIYYVELHWDEEV